MLLDELVTHRRQLVDLATRQSVRKTLYMATLTARTYSPLIRAIAHRLTKVGEPFKVVMVACLRKLLTVLNTMVRNPVEKFLAVLAFGGPRLTQLSPAPAVGFFAGGRSLRRLVREHHVADRGPE